MSNLDKQIKYWKESSKHDWAMVELLFKHKRYDYCLFFCHLSLEKLLKSMIVEKNSQVSSVYSRS